MTGRLWRGGMVFGGLMLLWGLASRSGIPHFLLPSPLAVAEALWVNRAPISAGIRLSRSVRS